MSEATENTPEQEMKDLYRDDKEFIKRDLKFGIPPSELTDAEIVDIMIYLRDMKSICEAREKLMNEALQSRYKTALQDLKMVYEKEGEKRYAKVVGGATPGIQYEYVVQKRLDNKAVEEEMGADWIEDHKKEVTFFQAKVVKEI